MNPSRYIGEEGLLTLLPAVFIIILFGSGVLVMILSDPECMSASFLLHLLIALSPSQFDRRRRRLFSERVANYSSQKSIGTIFCLFSVESRECSLCSTDFFSLALYLPLSLMLMMALLKGRQLADSYFYGLRPFAQDTQTGLRIFFGCSTCRQSICCFVSLLLA